MKPDPQLADLSRRFFQQHRVHRYRMKKVAEMTDAECIQCCHWYCEENHLTQEFEAFRREAEGGGWLDQ